MPALFTFTVDAVGNDEPVTVQTDCRRVVVYENNQAGSADYTVRAPFSTSPAVTRPAGSKTEFSRESGQGGFRAGETIAFVAMVSGSVTFVREEH